ncbi:hypothetical protein BJ944DRAFT_284726 [Cunninghamella echinulata]|nr:hypothetical protein BJ944DRAFT_284726 [Cunninghamella echinulata]
MSNIESDRELMKGKVAVVTGGSKGIGLALTTALVERGVKVVIGDVLSKEGENAASQLNKKTGAEVVLFQHCDVRYYKDLRKLFQVAESRFGGVDIACLNAGIAVNPCGIMAPLEDESEKLIHDVNTLGVIKGNKVAVMHMVKRGGGVIINTASVAGIIGGPGISAYAATKHAVNGWTRSLEHLYPSVNIRVNAVLPYWTKTDIIDIPAGEDGEPHPFTEVLHASPWTTMDHVIETFLELIRNDEHSGDCLIVAPDGYHEHPRTVLPESCISETMLEKLVEFHPKLIEKTRIQLQAASKQYFSKL